MIARSPLGMCRYKIWHIEYMDYFIYIYIYIATDIRINGIWRLRHWIGWTCILTWFNIVLVFYTQSINAMSCCYCWLFPCTVSYSLRQRLVNNSCTGELHQPGSRCFVRGSATAFFFWLGNSFPGARPPQTKQLKWMRVVSSANYTARTLAWLCNDEPKVMALKYYEWI